MKFHTQIDPIRQRVNVYCEMGAGDDGTRLFQVRHHDPLYEEPDTNLPPGIHRVPTGAEPPLWDWYPLEVVSELAEALNPRPPATARHLDDAIEVRDRLMLLVERAFPMPGPM